MTSHLSASLIRLKLLDCLRAGDVAKIDSLIADLSSVESTVDTTDLIRLRETILHYAVQIAPLATIQTLVESPQYKLDINAQDSDGNTPLHLAVAAGRLNVVKYFLSLADINDTVLNADRKQPVELARNTDIAQLMQYERAKFVEAAATELRRMFSSRNFDGLETMLVSNPRAAELLDINGADPETGNTVLHEFIRKEDYEMCEWILRHKGDPFKRDKRGKLPIDLVSSKADPIRRLLKAASRDQNMMDPVASTNNAIKAGNAPTYKGYLRKWTNFASGYKLRYFVLDQAGILSYYTNQGDTINACRGSLNLGFATLHLDSSEKLKFEIIGKNGIKWHLKANHPVETNRWVWTLQNAITLAKDNIKHKAKAPRRSVSITDPPRSAADEPEEERKRRMLHIPGRRRHKKTPSSVSLNSFVASDAEDNASVMSDSHSVSSKGNSQLMQIQERKVSQSDRFSADDSQYDHEDFDLDLDDSESDHDPDTNVDSPIDNIAKFSVDQIQATKRSIKVEVASLISLFEDLRVSSDPNAHTETFSVGLKTLSNINELIEQLDSYNAARDQKLLKKIERQQEVNKLWESSIRQLEHEIQKREETLSHFEGKKSQLRKLLQSKGISSAHVSNEHARGVINSQTPSKEIVTSAEEPKDGSDSLLDEIFNDSDDEFFDADDFEEDDLDSNDASEEVFDKVEGKSDVSSVSLPKVEVSEPVSKERQPVESKKSTDVSVAASSTTKSTDNVPEMKEKAVSDAQKNMLAKIEDEGSFLGYERPPRKKLSMDEDDRPKVGLWGILKSMIGKDMTRMTLPVSFNECTSLLQRLTEDVEYNELLNVAASIPDSTLRIVYVGAFAASEYASTIDRIAKPFNPLLGETYEYCRPDQSFRLLTEQVSHHPPISACHAESIKWDYYGENAVDSQLRVRSFDFKHLGKMFCTVRPDEGVIDKNGKKVAEELYSWKKVNTSVVGIIVGNPTVDNYGQMEIRNHTTGDVLIVDMKQRGWKASSAYQLSGTVTDAKGKECWAIGGRWNSKIYAKKISGGGLDKKRRNSMIDAQEEHSTDPYSGRSFLVWKAAPRPKVPFNLTSFALTLNEINDNIRPWLAPTDTRLRPDQRAMEDGRYDEASAEKHRLEEKQRSARKARELRRETYKPNWFVKSVHPVTGDKYWNYNDKYWPRRKNKQLGDTGDIY